MFETHSSPDPAKESHMCKLICMHMNRFVVSMNLWWDWKQSAQIGYRCMTVHLSEDNLFAALNRVSLWYMPLLCCSFNANNLFTRDQSWIRASSTISFHTYFSFFLELGNALYEVSGKIPFQAPVKSLEKLQHGGCITWPLTTHRVSGNAGSYLDQLIHWQSGSGRELSILKSMAQIRCPKKQQFN